jgi:hypothetical protein
MFLGNDLEIRTLEWSSVSLSFQRSTTRFPGTIPASWTRARTTVSSFTFQRSTTRFLRVLPQKCSSFSRKIKFIGNAPKKCTEFL